MKKTPLRKVSPKRRQMNKEWADVCNQKKHIQIMERGYVYCEICGLPEKNWEGGVIWGHHKDFNRRNNTIENCELDHWVCHQHKYHGGDKPN